MDNLPAAIKLEIFSRVPVETVLECKKVCKTWESLFSIEKNFADIHFQHQQELDNHNNGAASKISQGLIFLSKPQNKKNCGFQLYYGEYDERNTSADHEEQCIPRKLRFPLLQTSLVEDMRSLIGSCNGLICLTERKSPGLEDPIHIFNPITRECLRIQGFNENNKYDDVSEILSGFGYNSQTNEYKVVRIIYRRGFDIGLIQVYTLGGGSGWRNKGFFNSLLQPVHGVYVNGAIHWVCHNGKDVTSFNLADESFHVLPPVPFSGSLSQWPITSIIGPYGEWLCVTVCEGDTGHSADKCLNIWTLKKTSTVNEPEAWSWFMEFSIDVIPELSDSIDEPLALTKSGLFVLCYADEGAFFSYYDLKTATWKRFGTMKPFEAIPHTNSFVSLKDSGETTCKIRKSSSS